MSIEKVILRFLRVPIREPLRTSTTRQCGYQLATDLNALHVGLARWLWLRRYFCRSSPELLPRMPRNLPQETRRSGPQLDLATSISCG